MSKLIINGIEYQLRTEQTTIASVKKVISSVANARKIAKKDLSITLPTGKVVSFKDLDTFRDMVVEMNVGTFAGAEVDDVCAEEVGKLKYLTEAAYNTPLNFGELGSRDKTVFAEIAQNTYQRLLDNNQIDENHVKLIG